MPMSEHEVGQARETWFTLENMGPGDDRPTLWDVWPGFHAIRCVALTNMDMTKVEVHSDPEVVAMYLDA